MRGFAEDVVAAAGGLVNRATTGVAQLRRTTPGPALARLTTSLSAVAALILALPQPSLTIGQLALLLVAAAGVGLFPRTRWVGFVTVLTVALWVLSTTVFGVEAPLWRVGLLGATLYLTHSAAALAAVLPHDCVVAPSALGWWVVRVCAVLGASLAVALVGLAIAWRLPAEQTVIGPIIGSVLAAGVVGVLAWHLRRR